MRARLNGYLWGKGLSFWVQNLKEAVCISSSVNTIEKGLNLIIQPPAIATFYLVIATFNLGISTCLEDEKLTLVKDFERNDQQEVIPKHDMLYQLRQPHDQAKLRDQLESCNWYFDKGCSW